MENPSFKLVLSFAVASLAFLITMIAVGSGLPAGRPLDFVFGQQEVADLFAQYTNADKANHAWLTGRLDMIFPFVYGVFLGVAAKRYAPPPWEYLMAFWIVIGVIFDLTENVALLNIINGEDAFALKTVFTRAKFVFLAAPVIMCTKWFLTDLFNTKRARLY